MLASQPRMTPDEDATAARPKVMRRPAQFSKAAPPAMADTPHLPIPVAPEPPAPRAMRSHPWQEDGRFGLALVAILLAVNLALMLWLPHLVPAPATTAPQNPVVILGAAPAVTSQPVTLYAQPSRLEFRAAPGETPGLKLPAAGAP